MFKITLPYINESDIKRAEWVRNELYSGNDVVTVETSDFGNVVTISAKNDTRVKTKHFLTN
jgi:hypothetical protein